MKKFALLGRSVIMSVGLLSSYTITASDNLFSPLPDSKVAEQSLRHFSPYWLVTGIAGNKPQSIVVKGKVRRINYQLSPSYLPEHAVNNYLSQLEKHGAELLFHCNKDQCGNWDKLQRMVGPLNKLSERNPSLVTAKLTSDMKSMYVSVYATNWKNGMNVQLDVVEVIEEPLDLVEIDSTFLRSNVKQVSYTNQSHKDKKGASDHPMIQRLPGAYIWEYKQFGFKQTPIALGKNLNVEQRKGKVTSIGYHLPRTYSEYEVDANYKAAFEKLGFELQASCSGRECGNEKRFVEKIQSVVYNGNEKSQRYRFYTLKREEGDVHGLVYVIGYKGALWAEVRLIEETALVDDRVEIDLDGLINGIDQNGYVALDGLLFKFDSDEMLPEATPVLNILTEYLKGNPKGLFYVVGHTDDKGTQQYNSALSERRAKAVVNALVNQHRIPKGQLTAKGMGEFSPVANNSHEQGQKQNRRVELVLRSDNK